MLILSFLICELWRAIKNERLLEFVFPLLLQCNGWEARYSGLVGLFVIKLAAQDVWKSITFLQRLLNNKKALGNPAHLKSAVLLCRNKKSLKNLYRLVVRPHRDAVYHACFSEDKQRIASCGADKTLQVRYLCMSEKRCCIPSLIALLTVLSLFFCSCLEILGIENILEANDWKGCIIT